MKHKVVVILSVLVLSFGIVSLSFGDDLMQGLWLYNCHNDGAMYKAFGDYEAFNPEWLDDSAFNDSIVSPAPLNYQEIDINDIDIVDNTDSGKWGAVKTLIEMHTDFGEEWYGFSVQRVVIDPC